jgi:hypothetical protein
MQRKIRRQLAAAEIGRSVNAPFVGNSTFITNPNGNLSLETHLGPAPDFSGMPHDAASIPIHRLRARTGVRAKSIVGGQQHVTAVEMADRIDATHEGGGVTAGITAAYRVWRGLEFGLDVDHYRGFPHNIATLYGASLEWRLGAAR